MRQTQSVVHPTQMIDTVGGLLATATASTPDATAVVTPGGQCSYRVLHVAALGYAERISRVGGADPVVVHQDGTVDAIARSFGVMMSGRALVAVDTGLPLDRVDRIVATAGAVVMPSDTDPGHSQSMSPDGPDRARPTDIAMICYTSGSTGEPKGVLLSHQTVVAKVRDVVDGQQLRPTDRLGDLLPLGFSAGINTLIAGIACGATVVCADPRDTDVPSLVSWLGAQNVTTLHTSVVLARGIGTAIEAGTVAAPTSVRQVAFYGEAASASDVAQARRISDPAPTVVNWYAATEVGVIGRSVFGPGADMPDDRVHAGTPLAGRTVTVVDGAGQTVIDGSVGEVVVGGGPIADGYLGRTSSRFLTDTTGRRGYRTGDRGRIDGAGNLHLAGRIDDAVKIRGYLVEPSEVESALHGIDGVDEAFVTSTTRGGRVDLVAYVSGAVASTADMENHVRASLRTALPEWMIPRFVVTLTALPRTERGKLDRSALPEPTAMSAHTARPGRTPGGRAHRRSSPDIVESVARFAVSLAMGSDDIDADADLMALGADSLALARISTTVRQRINGDIDFAPFTTTPTIATLAGSIRDHYRNGGGVGAGNGVLVPIRAGADTTSDAMRPLFVVAGAGGPASSLMAMARYLAPGRAVHGLQAMGLERTGRPDRSVTAMARRYVDLIIEIQPKGPYLLAGHSMGGIVALEMAAQLADRGERTEQVIQIDTSLTSTLIADLKIEEDLSADITDEEAEPEVPYRPDVAVSKRQLLTLVLKVPLAGRIIFDPVTQWIIFYRHGGRLTDRHRLRRIAAPVTVLAAPGTRHRRRWWGAVTTGEVAIRPVRGGHVELLHDPYVADVASIVDEVLAPDQN